VDFYHKLNLFINHKLIKHRIFAFCKYLKDVSKIVSLGLNQPGTAVAVRMCTGAAGTGIQGIQCGSHGLYNLWKPLVQAALGFGPFLFDIFLSHGCEVFDIRTSDMTVHATLAKDGIGNGKSEKTKSYKAAHCFMLLYLYYENVKVGVGLAF
jgi:hypothetical protein